MRHFAASRPRRRSTQDLDVDLAVMLALLKHVHVGTFARYIHLARTPRGPEHDPGRRRRRQTR